MTILAILSMTAHATLPLETFPECGLADEEAAVCPNDFNADWEFISYIRDSALDSVRPAELELGSGISADLAWGQTTGRFDTILAVGDSGVTWHDSAFRRKIALKLEELPLPQDETGQDVGEYDLDGDGVVTVDDWAFDPRVDWASGDPEGEGVIDAGDLIATFSDGVDDDGNGYVDDIAGWDFIEGDNNPYARKRDEYGRHGDEGIERAASEGGDVDVNGDIGVCPNCSALPMRLGNTFIVDGARVAEAIAYAADRGASSMGFAVGALSNPSAVQRAADYAWDQGMVLIGAAGDENAYHRNFPATDDHFLFVKSIRGDNANENGEPYSFMNQWNCNNFGPRLDLVAPAHSCATGAVAMTNGTVGLIVSAARDQGIELTPAQVHQLLFQTTDDVYLTEAEQAEARTYPSSEGWDQYFGYGRINAGAAVQAVIDGEIPPEATITSPEWFHHHDRAGEELRIDGAVSAPYSTGFTYEIAWGIGAEPTEWNTFATGSGNEAEEGTLATLNLAEVPSITTPAPALEETLLERVDRAHSSTLTILLTVTDDDGRVATQRRSVVIEDDPDILPGFPKQMGASLESSPILADITGDRVFEIIFGTSDGEVHALMGDGSSVPGFPVGVEPHDTPELGGQVGDIPDVVQATVAVGDIDGDGSNEIVAGTLQGFLYVWSAEGELREGFPVATIGHPVDQLDGDDDVDVGIAGAPTLVDLDDDGTLEILVTAMDGRIYAWDGAGQDWGPYPLEICHPENCGKTFTGIVASATVGDLDGDGDLDITLGTTETVDQGRASVSHAFDAATGESLPGWPVSERGLVSEAGLIPTIGTGHPATNAVADLDGDGDLEIISPIMLGQTDLLHHDGTLYAELPYTADQYGPDAFTTAPSLAQMIANPAFGDMTGDGTPDLVVGTAGTIYLAGLFLTTYIDYQMAVGAWDGKTGQFLNAWPQQIEDLQFLMSPAVADLDGDGDAEAIMGSAGGLIHAWDADGNRTEGWPKNTAQWLLGSPAVGDIDGDGYLDVVATSREGNIFAWRTNGPADQKVQWASIHHDPQNTGNYATPLAVQEGPAAAGCCQKKGSGSAAWLLLPALLGLGWRRRREA